MPSHDDDTFTDVIAMRVGGIVVDERTQVPVMVLRGVDEPRLYLPIFIGGLEATAIATVLADVSLPRPMTHDLMAATLKTLGCAVVKITVTKLEEGTFYAALQVRDAAGREHVIDARPSDSVALALRLDAPIFVHREVVAEAGAMSEDPEATPPDPEDPTAATADVEEGPHVMPDHDVRLEDLDPEDFGKYKM